MNNFIMGDYIIVTSSDKGHGETNPLYFESKQDLEKELEYRKKLSEAYGLSEVDVWPILIEKK